MKKFSPKMSDGMGAPMAMAPEAHSEWKDKEGKHSIDYHAIGAKSVGDSVKTPSEYLGPDGKGKLGGLKQADIRKHESAIKAKGKEAGMHGGISSAGKAAIGHKTGPQHHAGKGASGVTKGMARSNRKGVGGAGR